MKIFISHSHEEQAIFSAVYVALQSNDVDCWNSSTMSPGEALADQLRVAIGACRLCVFIGTRRSLSSTWCLAELGAFWGAGKKVILFVADPGVQESDFPPQFKGSLRVASAQELITAVKKNVSQDEVEYPESFYYYGKVRSLRREEVFQDFKIVEKAHKGNVNAIQHTWADATPPGSYLRALVIETEGVLRLTFHNADGAYPCNVAIRGKADRPLENRPGKRYLAFGARLHEEKGSDTSPVAIAVRVVNGFMQHWIYGNSASSYICQTITTTSWERVLIDLSEGETVVGEKPKKDLDWHKFESDGNPEGPSRPSFECICSVVLEIGSPILNRPSGGSGTLDVGPLVLLNKARDYDRYLVSSAGPVRVRTE